MDTTTYPRPGHEQDHYGSCSLHNVPCCQICCRHEGECDYGTCTEPAIAEVACYASGGRLVERRPACASHATTGPTGVGYGSPAAAEVAA